MHKRLGRKGDDKQTKERCVYCINQPSIVGIFSPFFLDLYGQVDLCSKRGGDKVKKTRKVAKKDSSTPHCYEKGLPPFSPTTIEEEILNAKKPSFPFWRERVVGHLPIAFFLGGGRMWVPANFFGLHLREKGLWSLNLSGCVWNNRGLST